MTGDQKLKNQPNPFTLQKVKNDSNYIQQIFKASAKDVTKDATKLP